MSQYKKIALMFCLTAVLSAVAVSYSFKELGKCINKINYANEEKSKSSLCAEENRILGSEIGGADFLDKDVYYNVAENGDCLYYYCKNQYLEMSSQTRAVLYFCCDRPIGASVYSETECGHIASVMTRECLNGALKVAPRITNAAFDGRRYVYYMSLGEYGGAIVHVAADSGKVLLFDGRNINIF